MKKLNNKGITTIELMKSFVLNNIGIGFTNIEDIKEVEKEQEKLNDQIPNQDRIPGKTAGRV